MKKTILIAALVFSISGTSYAQERPDDSALISWGNSADFCTMKPNRQASRDITGIFAVTAGEEYRQVYLITTRGILADRMALRRLEGGKWMGICSVPMGGGKRFRYLIDF